MLYRDILHRDISVSIIHFKGYKHAVFETCYITPLSLLTDIKTCSSKIQKSFGLKKSIKWLNKETVKVEEKQT